MISVETLYQTISDLVRLDESGHLSNDEFNRHLAISQQLLYDYYMRGIEVTMRVPEGLYPFVATQDLTLGSDSLYAYPTDYRHDLEDHEYRESYNPTDGTGVKWNSWPILYARMNQVQINKGNTFRAPDKQTSRFFYSVASGKLALFPDGLPGVFRFKYLRTPLAATRAVTIDTVNKVENLDAGNTVDLEWPSKELQNFVDLFSLLLGLSVRESELVNWVRAQNVHVAQEMT